MKRGCRGGRRERRRVLAGLTEVHSSFRREPTENWHRGGGTRPINRRVSLPADKHKHTDRHLHTGLSPETIQYETHCSFVCTHRRTTRFSSACTVAATDFHLRSPHPAAVSLYLYCIFYTRVNINDSVLHTLWSLLSFLITSSSPFLHSLYLFPFFYILCFRLIEDAL